MADTESGMTGPLGRRQPDDQSSSEVIPVLRLPIFGDKLRQVPAFIVPRLTEMASDLPDTDLARRIYYERANALLAIALIAMSKDPATFNLDEPPSDGFIWDYDSGTYSPRTPHSESPLSGRQPSPRRVLACMSRRFS